MKELAEKATLGRLICHALTASSLVGILSLLLQTIKTGHEARTLFIADQYVTF